MSFHHDIYVIRSAASPWTEPGKVGEELRSVAMDGQKEIRQLGSHLMGVINEPIREVRFAPANRTRSTALGVIGLTYSSIVLRRDERLTETDPERITHYLEEVAEGPAVLFTHLDVIQSMVEAATRSRPDEETIPTASLTKFHREPAGLTLEYAGKTIDEAITDAKR